MTFLEEYIQAFETGEILVGQELEFVLHQLQKETQDPRYRYEPKRAKKRIQFIERFCKHTKSPFHGKPFKLELWEKAFIEVIYAT
jgi:phage terminase large subunit-like protein